MAISTLVDLVAIYVNSGNAGNLTLGSAVPGFRGVSALTNGATYSYSIQQTAEWEYGTCVYLADTQSVVRTPEGSSNGGAPIYVRSGTQLTFTALAKDIIATGATLPIVDSLGNATDKAISQKAATDAIGAKYDADNPSEYVDAAGALASMISAIVDGTATFDLPTAEPTTAGALWNNGGFVAISTGTTGDIS